MNILYVITDLEIGGTERKLAHLCAALDRTRVQPVVVALAGGPVETTIRRLNIPLYVLNLRRTNVISSLWSLCRIIRKHRIDLIHGFLFHANIISAIAARLTRRPVLWSAETLEGPTWHYSISRMFRSVPDHIFCVSEAVRKFYGATVGVSGAELSVVPNGVPEVGSPWIRHTQDAGVRREAVIVTASRLDPGKGIADVLDAVALLTQEGHRVVFYIAGDGPERRRLERYAERRGVRDRVRFLGWCDNIFDVLSDADLLVHPSHLREGLPLSVLETMAAGKAVIATDTGGTRDLIDHDQTGFLVRVGDIQGMYNKMKWLLSDPNRMVRMGEAGRQKVKKQFSVGRMCEGYARIYEETV